MSKIRDEELEQLAEIYNKEGRKYLYELLRNQYEIKNPYVVLNRMKKKEHLGYDPEQDCFLIQADLAEADDSVFMSIEELCTPSVSERVKPQDEFAETKSAAMEKLIHELIGDRLLAISRYVILDSVSKKMIVDKTSLLSDGYQLVTH